MPRLRIIILDQDNGNINSYRYVLWADVPSARQRYYANATAVSAWKDALAADNTNLQSGAVVERVTTQSIPSGSSLAQIEAFLQARWADFQSSVTSSNPWIRYGSTWDGTTWTVVTGS